nr:hypothetical protein [Tanacetum cinerariifolium]
MAKLILNEAQTEQYLAEPNISSNEKYELDEELLQELRRNSYSERVEEDVIGYIAKILEEYKKMVDEQGRWKNQHLGRVEVRNNERLIDEGISSDNDRDQSNSSMITKPDIKMGGEFLKILHDNSFNGMDGSDINEHIGKVLEITKWIKIPNVDKDELRLHVFSKSLNGDAKKWWDNEEAATTWNKLCDKSFYKYYSLSHTYKSNIPDDLGHKTDYFEFLYWLASKINNYWELARTSKMDYGSFMLMPN